MLARQREDFLAKLKPNLTAASKLQSELRHVNDIVRALQVSIEQIDAAMAAIDKAQARTSGARPKIMNVVLEILERAPSGMTAREIMTEINTRGLLGEPIQRHSLSPQLSRLKDRDKKIDLVGEKWILKPQTDPTLFTVKDRRL